MIKCSNIIESTVSFVSNKRSRSPGNQEPTINSSHSKGREVSYSRMKRAAEPTWGRFPCEQQSTRSLVKERHPTFISTTPPQLLHTRREKMLHSEPKAHPKINSQQPRTRSLATEFILVGMAWHPILSLLQVSSYIFTMDLPAVLF